MHKQNNLSNLNALHPPKSVKNLLHNMGCGHTKSNGAFLFIESIDIQLQI